MARPKRREKEIETAFVSYEDTTDLPNGLTTAQLKNRAASAMGSDIGSSNLTTSMHQQVAGAFRKILEVTDPKALLAKSSWCPGVQLQESACPHRRARFTVMQRGENVDPSDRKLRTRMWLLSKDRRWPP